MLQTRFKSQRQIQRKRGAAITCSITFMSSRRDPHICHVLRWCVIVTETERQRCIDTFETEDVHNSFVARINDSNKGLCCFASHHPVLITRVSKEEVFRLRAQLLENLVAHLQRIKTHACFPETLKNQPPRLFGILH